MKLFMVCFFMLALGCSSLPERNQVRVQKPPQAVLAQTQTQPPTPLPPGASQPSTAQLMAQFRQLVKNSQWAEVISSSDQLLTFGLSEPLLSEVFHQRIRAQEALGEYLSALYSAASAIKTLAQNSGFKIKATEIIDAKLTNENLQIVAGDSEFGSLRANAYFRLGEAALESRNQDEARSNFSRAASIAPDTDLGRSANDRVDQLEAVRRVDPKTIGVVLPMTGKHAGISQKVLRGLQMGLGLYGNNTSSFRLAVVDSEANPDMARRAVERLVREDNVIAVVGSVLSKNATAVASKTAELGVPSLALSQRSGITDISETVFRNALTSEMQVRHLVKVAIEDLKIKKFAVVFPNDQYGVEFTNIFWDEVLARGGQITAAQSYSSKETDFRNVVQRLVGTYYTEARADEYRLRLKEWSDSVQNKTARTTPPDDLLPPVVSFEAVFVPDSAKSLGQIAAMLNYSGVKGMRLLGTNLWNVGGLTKRVPANTPVLFVDSFLSTGSEYQNSAFIRDYKALFNQDPGIFEIQGYDSGLLLRQLISMGNTSRESLSYALSQVQNFPGALGKMSISEEREIFRPVIALTLESGQIVPYLQKSSP